MAFSDKHYASFFERLEDRVLFDGVPDATFISMPMEQAAPTTPQSSPLSQSQSASPTELIIIDSNVQNSDALLESLIESNPSTAFTIHVLDVSTDGVQQITDFLSASNTQFEAIHILSHGSAGNVQLGDTLLSNDNVSSYVDELASWSSSLTQNADLLFYGCDLALDADGQSLIQTVSAVTGADVAASIDVTGDSAQNADWVLEFASGQIETRSLSSHNWSGTLAIEATDGVVTIENAENSGAGTITLTNNGAPEVVTVINTPTRVGQMLERVWQFNETADTGRATFVFDVSGIAGINATIASEFGLIVSDQPDLADGPNTTTLVASGYDAANGLVFFHQVDLNSGDYFGLATEVVQDNFSVFPTATGLEDSSIDLGLTLSPALTQGGQLQDIIATDAGFRSSTAGTTTTDFFIPAGTTGIRITGFSTRDIGTAANDQFNDDYQFLNVSIDLGSETSNGYIGHIIDQGPSRSDQFGFSDAPLGTSVLTGGGTIVGDANNNIDPTFSIVDGVLMVQENHQLQTSYHVEFLTNATSSAEFIRTESAVLESNDQSLATLNIPANTGFLVVNITDAAAGASAQIEYKGNSRVYIDLATLTASGVVAAQQGETDARVVNYAFEDYDVSSAAVGSILSAAGDIVGDTTGLATTLNDNQIYINAAGDLVIDRNDSFASNFNSLITVEYYERRDVGSSAEQLGESTDFGLFDSDPSNPTSTLEFDIPDNATLGILNLTQNGTNSSDTNENSGSAFAVIDLVNGTSSGSIYFVRASSRVDLVGWDATPFGTAFFDDPNSISNHTNINQFNDPFAGTATLNLTNGGSTLELAVNSNGRGSQSFLDYFAGGQVEWFGAAPFEVTGSSTGGTFSQGTLNPATGNFELTIAEAAMGLSFIPSPHVSGTIPVDVTLRIGDEVETTAVTVQAVIDPIDFSMAPDACGHEDTDISISANITPTFIDQDGSETITSQILSNIPIGHTLTDGTNTFVSSAGSQSVDITAWNPNTITYRANPNESGTFTITMDVDWQDVGGGVTDTDSLQTTFDVVVKPINDPPVAVDDFYTVLGGTTLNTTVANGVLTNDSDPESDPLTVNTTPLSGPSNGTLALNSDGTFTYTPNAGFAGTDSFDYQISDGNGATATATAFIDVSVPVTGPLNAVDDAVTTNEETPINISVQNNDALPTTGSFNIQSTTPPSNGAITVLPNGTIDYTPNANFFGTDTFTYTLADASGRTSTATVTVTVNNVQDPPVANADSGSTSEDTTLPSINILANDSDPDNDVLTVTTAVAANGTVVINADGTIDYTPNPGFNGTDTVNYTITDGNGGFASSTVLINVVPVADPPTSADNAVTTVEEISYTFLASDFPFADQDPSDSLVTVRIDTLPADGQLLINGNPATAGQVVSLTEINNGNLIFVPDPNGFGNNYTTFEFSVSDGILFQTVPNTMTINVTPVQDPPVATNNAITVNEDSIANPLGLAPPTDVDGDTLTATVTGLPTQGIVYLADGVTVVNNGDMLTVAQLTTLVYDAPTDFTTANAGSFTYDITDGIDTDSGQVDITIVSVNDAPNVDLNGGPTGNDYADTFTEGGAPVAIAAPTVDVTDQDDIRLPFVKIDVDATTIVDPGDEFLEIGGVDFQLDAAADSTTTVTIGATNYDVTFTAATARFDIVRTDGLELTLAQAEVVLRTTTYRNDSVLPTTGDRAFEICTNDGDVDSNTATTVIRVVRDAEPAQWSITGTSSVIDGNSATYTLALSNPLRSGETASVDIGLMDIDTTSADYGALSTAISAAVSAYSGPGTVTFNGTTLTFTSDGTGAMAPLLFTLPTTPDGVYEGDEDFKISLSNPSSTTGQAITIDAAADEVVTTIIDNTPAPTVSIVGSFNTEGSPVRFLISLDVASFEDITLDLATSSGSAIAGVDFETTNFEFFDGTVWLPAVAGTQVTLPAGTTSLDIRVDSAQDTLVELDETFTLSASVIAGTVTSASDTGTGTIIDDDVPNISVDDVTVDEDNGTITFTVALDQAPVAPVSVDWATSSGSAISGVDFTGASGTANFAAGVQTQTVTIAITQDNIFEGPHTFDLNLSNASGGTIADNLGVGTIVDDGTGPNRSDDDRPIISINNVTSTETVDTHAVFTISLSNPSVENTDLSLALLDGTATSGADYGPGLEFFDGTAWQAVTGNVTILAGSTSIEIRTPILDDPIADSNETFTLVATRVNGTTFNTSATGTGTILDDADPTLASITGPASVIEGSPAVYTVALSNTPITPVALTFAYSGTANDGTDYTGVATISIAAGSTTGTVTIPTIDDTLGEPLENFTITINSATGGSFENFQIDPINFQVTTDIIDDDIPAIDVNDVIVTEGTDPFAEFTVELSNPTFETIDFSILASGVSAIGETIDFGILGLNELEVFNGTNFVPATSASFAPGDTTILLRTPITDDALAEAIETFTVTVTTTTGTTSNPSDTGTGTIQDDTTDLETVLVSIVGPPSVVEGATTTNYTIDLTDPTGLPINAAADVTVTLAYTGVAADGADFTGVATVVIPAGSASGTFALPTVNDSLFEGSEDIIITIDSVTGGGFEGIAADPAADTVTTLITDDADIPTVAINNVTSVEGTDNFARFNVTLSNLSVQDIDISLALTGGTAIGGGVDFGSAGAGNLQIFNGTTWVDATTATIAAGDSIAEFRVPIIDDLIDEPTENYTLTVDVTAGTTTNIQVIGTGTIIDNDPAPDVTIADATATEGDPLVFNVTLSNPSSQAIVLDFATGDITATATTDYNATALEFSTDGGVTWMAAVGGSQATIPAGSNGILVRVFTTEDLTLETTETLELGISGVVSGLVGDTTDTAMGTIIDDDAALVSIVANDPIAGEPSNDGQFTVSITNPSDTATVIAYTVAGSATSGVDFAALAGTITIPAGATSGTIDLMVIDDTIIEGIEDVTIALTSIVSGDADISIDAANNTDTATISDNDAAVWALTGDTTVNEGADATYNLTLNGALQSGESTSVDLTLSDTTTTPADYASFDSAVAAAVAAYTGPGTVTWDGTTLTFTSDGTGQMDPLIINVTAINDAVVEGVEEYNVAISGAASTTGIAVGIDALNNSVDTEIQDTIDAAGTAFDKANWTITGATLVSEGNTTNYTITIDATLQALEVAEVDISLTNIDTTAGDVSALNAAVVTAVANYNASGQPGSLTFDGTTLRFTSDGTGPLGNLVIQISANADGFLEGPEDYSIQLTNPNSTTGACIGLDVNDSVTTTINPDSTAAVWSIIVDNSGDEGSTVSYDIQLTQALGAGDSATVELALNDVDTNPTDYGNFVAAVNDAILAYTGPGTLTFDGTTLTYTATNDGDMMTGLTIDLDLIDDPIVEGVETFTIDLSNPDGPTGVNVAVSTTDDSVTTTIIDTIGVGGAPDIATWSVTGPASGDEGTNAQYTIELNGALGAGESVSVVLSLTDVDTTSGDYASIIAAASAAAAANPDVTFDPITGAFTFTAPSDGAMMAPLVIDLGLATDAISEGPEDFEIALSAATSSTGAAVTIDSAADMVTTTINDLTAPLEWAITGPLNADEGASAQYTVTLGGSLGAGETASVVIELTDLTTTASDYADIQAAITSAISGNPNLAYDPASGTLTFTSPTDGATMPPLVIDLGIVNDAFIEGSEFYTIGLSNPSSTTGAATTISTTDNLVTTEIFDTQGAGLAPDQAVWRITGDTTVVEGGTASYTVTLVGQFGAGEVATVELGQANIDTSNTDYSSLIAAVNSAVAAYTGPGTVTFDGTTITFTATNDGDVMSDLVIDLGTVDDLLIEGDEDYTVSILNPGSTTGGTVLVNNTSRIVTTTIIDNDAALWQLTGDTTVNEGADATYQLILTGTLQSGESSTVDLSIANITTNSTDYASFSNAVATAVAAYTGPGTVAWDGATFTFTSDGTGPMAALTIDLNAINDTIVEGTQQYNVSISNPVSTTGIAVSIDAINNSIDTQIQDTVDAAGTALDTALWSIGVDNANDEGGAVQYTIALSQTFGAGESATVDIGINDIDTNSSDYANFAGQVSAAVAAYSGPGSLTFDGTTLTFTATADGDGMTDLVILLGLSNDAIVEGVESFTVDLTNPTSPTGAAVSIVPNQASVTTTINDTQNVGGAPDVAIWSIIGPTSGNEGSTVTYRVGLNGAIGLGESISVDLNLNDLTTNGNDYASIVAAVTAAAAADPDVTFNAATGTLTYTAPTDGASLTPLTINLGLSTDTLSEGNEDFQLELTNPASSTGAAVAVNPNLSDVVTTIIDQTAATQWSITGPAFEDEGGSAVYIVEFTGSLGAGDTATVTIELTDITTNAADLGSFNGAIIAAIAGNPDLSYDPATGALTFTSPTDGATLPAINVALPVLNDALVEGAEQYSISLSSPSSTTGAAVSVSPTDSSVTTTINDTQNVGGALDSALWTITGSASVSEGANATYVVALNGAFGAGESVSVDIGLANVDTNSSDYAPFVAAVNSAVAAYTGPGTVSFNGTTLTYTAGADGDVMDDLVIDLLAVDDVLIEGAEDLTVALSGAATTTGAAVSIGAANDSVTTTIIDDDVAVWRITGDTTVGEGAIAQYTVTLDGQLGAGEVVTVEIGNANIDTANTDYLDLVAAVNSTIAAYAGPGTVTFDGTTITFTAAMDGDAMSDLVINLGTVDDLIAEGNEDYAVSISNPGSTTGGTVFTDNTSRIVTTTIIDNDVTQWTITGDPTVTEGGNAKYSVGLTGTLQAGETATIELAIGNTDTTSTDYVNFVTAVNTAIANYTGPGALSFDGTTLTFTSDGNPMGDLCIELPTVDDTLTEGAEDFTVSILNPSTTTGSLISTGGPTTVTTTITDNDSAIWSISGDATVSEGANAQYTIALAGTLEAGETATVELALGDTTTTSADYSSFVAAVNTAITNYTGPGALTFDGTTLTFTSDGSPMGDLRIELTAIDDTITEGSENFSVSLNNSGSTTGSSITALTNSVTTTIFDNDAVGWSIIGDGVVDEGGTAQYTISLNGILQAGEDARVELTLSDLETNSADYDTFITAVENAVAARSDLAFDAATGTLIVTGTGAPTADLIISLDAIDDTVIEGAERYQVLLSNATSLTGSATNIDATRNTVTTTIQDTIGDGGVLETALWSIGVDQTVAEGNSAAYVLNLAGNLQAGERISVDIKLSDVDTIATDRGSLDSAVALAVAAYSGPGSVAWDGTTLTFTSDGTGPMDSLTIALATVNDSFAEGAEDFLIALCNSNSPTGAANAIDATNDDVVTTIDDTSGPGADDVIWTIVGNNNVDEGGTATYTISLTGQLAAGNDATVELSIGDTDTTSADYAGFNAAVVAAVADYNAGSNPGSVTFDGTTLTFTAAADGDLLTGLVIDLEAIDDAFLEGPETYDVTLANSGSNTGIVVAIDPALNTVLTTINDTDGDGGPSEPGGQWSITGLTAVNEGDPITFTISLTGNLQAGESTTVQLGISDLETNSSDYSNVSAAVNAAVVAYNNNPSNPGTLNWDGTALTFVSDGTGPMNDLDVTFVSINDLLIEGDERLNLAVSNASSTTGLSPTISTTDSVVTTTIIDNDTPEWSITGTAIAGEGSTADYTISLAGVFQAGEVVSVDIGLTDIDTTSGDYGSLIAAISAAVAANPDVVFDATTATLTYTAPADGASMADLIIQLPITSDGISEAPEDFVVALSNPSSSTGVSPTLAPAADDVLTTINGSPIANPDNFFTNIDTPFVGNVLVNDSDPDGDVLTVTEINGQPIGAPILTDSGTVVMNPNGSFTFTPLPGFSGVGEFEYTVIDEFGNQQTETVTITVNSAEIGSAKSVSDAVPNGDNFDLTFTIVVGNLGNVALDNLMVFDDVAARFGSALVATTAPTILNTEGIANPPTINPAWTGDTSQNLITGGVLQPGASFQLVFTVTIDPDAAGSAQELGNQATVSGQGINPDGSVMTDSSGNPVVATDDSDSGTNPSGENGNEGSVDGIPGNDVTEIVIADLGVAKAVAGQPDLLPTGNYLVAFRVVVENTGTVDLASLSLQEDLSTQFGDSFVGISGLQLTDSPSDAGSDIAVNPVFDGATVTELLDTANSVLTVGDSFTLEFSVELDPTSVAGSIGNQISATAGAIDSNGNALLDSSGNPISASDLSDSGNDPGSTNAGSPDDTGSSADITTFTPPAVPLGEISGTVFVDDNNNGILDPGENGIAGVEINLTGTDVFGFAVDLTVLTDAAGNYSFENLVAGTYDVFETQPGQFSDGSDSSDAAASIGNDQFNAISLGFGESVQDNNFGERLTGTSGNPSRLPPILSLASERLNNRISDFLGGPGPIYSGVPIASNANPLTLDSGRAVTGGYATEFAVAAPVESCVPCNEAAVVTDVVNSQQGFTDETSATEEVSQEFVECRTCAEETTTCDTCKECSNCCGCCDDPASVQRQGVLFRLTNWLRKR